MAVAAGGWGRGGLFFVIHRCLLAQSSVAIVFALQAQLRGKAKDG
jgi:hypothetical protein